MVILQAHDAWATRKMLSACAKLSSEEFRREFEIGHGSLHNNLTHIIGAMRRWADRIAQRTLRPSIERPPEARDRSPTRLLEMFEEAAADVRGVVASLVASGELDRRIDFTFDGPTSTQTVTLPARVALVHLHTHGQHHRTQCLNMLRHLGYPSDSSDYDAVEWHVRGRGGANG